MEFNAESLVVILFCIALIGVSGWRLNVFLKKKEMTLSEYLKQTFHRDWTVLILGFLAFLCLGEGLFAAFIKGTGTEVNVFARFIAHVTVSLMSIVFSIGTPKMMVDTIEVFLEMRGDKKKRKPITYLLLIWNTLAVFFLITCALFVPFINLYIISVGIGKTQEMWFAFNEWILQRDLYDVYLQLVDIQHPNWERKRQELFAYNYNPLIDMGYMGAASFLIYIVHILVALADGVITASQAIYEKYQNKFGDSSNRTKRAYKKYKEEKTSSKKKKEERKEQALDEPEKIIEDLLLFMDTYEDDDERGKKVNQLTEIFTQDLLDNQQTRIATKMAERISDIDNYYDLEDDREDSKNQKMKSDIQNKIARLFRTSPERGGFGQAIKTGS